MQAGRLKIVFMGTPDFAVSTLDGIVSTGHEVALAVTQPDRQAGRGLRCLPSPVKKRALELNIEVITPAKIKSEEVISKIKKEKPDLIIVSAYGKMLPKAILDIPRLNCINIHASLLPKYRGAAPINWAIIRGERKTGITVMKMSEKMDAGDIFLQKEIQIEGSDNAGSLHDKLAGLAKTAVIEAIERMARGEITFEPQDESQASLAPMLRKEDGMIEWSRNSMEIVNFVRGMNPWPGACTYLEGRLIKIYSAERGPGMGPEDLRRFENGRIQVAKDTVMVKTGDGSVLIRELQRESKRRMTSAEFIKGFPNLAGKMFSGAKT